MALLSPEFVNRPSTLSGSAPDSTQTSDQPRPPPSPRSRQPTRQNAPQPHGGGAGGADGSTGRGGPLPPPTIAPAASPRPGSRRLSEVRRPTPPAVGGLRPPSARWPLGAGAEPRTRHPRLDPPACAAQFMGCGSGKVAAYESGGASGFRRFPSSPSPQHPPPSPPLSGCGFPVGGRGRRRHRDGLPLVQLNRPQGSRITAAPPCAPCAFAPRGGALVPV